MNKILVIEDETAVRENILELLEYGGGYEVVGAPNGRVGLEYAQVYTPDLILCDIIMPDMNGYAVLEAVRKTPAIAATPFIFLTARADRSFMRHGMELGADDYLTKPFTSVELMAAVHARLDRHQTTSNSLSQELESVKHKLVQMVAHELRTPLSTISMTTEIIAQQIAWLTADQLQECLTIIDHGSERLQHLIEQMVLYTQLKTGVLAPDTVSELGPPYRISDILNAALNLARRFAYRNQDAAVALVMDDPDVLVQADRRALVHAVAELLANALNFSPEDASVVVAQWHSLETVWVRITDRGPGMSRQQLKEALDEFGQVDRARHEQQGMGFGIPLAHGIVNAHGGEIGIVSTPGEGTQVTIELPFAGTSGEE